MDSCAEMNISNERELDGQSNFFFARQVFTPVIFTSPMETISATKICRN